MEKTKNNSVWNAAVIGLKLLLICAIIAGLVSFVYTLTASTYEENIKSSKELAVGKIFTGEENTRLPYSELAKADNATVSSVYKGVSLLGYCVEITTPGFGGDIELMIGYNVDCTIRNVVIISHTETPGLGAKYADSDTYFMDNYGGKSGEVGEVDAFASATKTANYIRDGVNRATALLNSALEKGGVENNEGLA